jgi:hypothetical protein
MIHLRADWLFNHKKHIKIDEKNLNYPHPTSEFKNSLSKQDQKLLSLSNVDLLNAFITKINSHFNFFFVFYDTISGDKILLKKKDFEVIFGLNKSVNGYFVKNQTHLG